MATDQKEREIDPRVRRTKLAVPGPEAAVMTNIVPMWKRRLDKIRESCPSFMPLAVGRIGEHGVTHVLICGEKVSWAEYCEHVGLAPTLEGRYPKR